MPLFSTNQPSIRARLLPRFPAKVLGGSGITITKDGGTYIFSLTQGIIPISALAPITPSTLVGRGNTTPGAGPPEPIGVTGGLTFFGTTLQLSPNQRTRSLNAQFDFVPPGTFDVFQDFYVAAASIIRSVILLADVPGVAIMDIWKTSFAGFPPTGANTICGTQKPTLGSAGPPAVTAQKSLFTSAQMTAAGWTINVNAGDVIRVVAGQVTGINQLVCAAEVEIL